MIYLSYYSVVIAIWDLFLRPVFCYFNYQILEYHLLLSKSINNLQHKNISTMTYATPLKHCWWFQCPWDATLALECRLVGVTISSLIIHSTLYASTRVSASWCYHKLIDHTQDLLPATQEAEGGEAGPAGRFGLGLSRWDGRRVAP